MGQGTPIEPADMTPQGLLGLARRKAEETRHEFRALAAALLGGEEAGLTDRQRATLSRLLHELVAETDADIRRRVLAADEGAELPVPPAPVAAERSYAIMSESGAFADGLLVEAAVQRLYRHQLERAVRAPAREGWLGGAQNSEEDLAAVLKVGETSPLRRLIAAYQVERSGQADAYGEPKLPARDIAAEPRARLYWDCAAAVRETLSEGDRPAASGLDICVEQAARAALADVGDEAASATALARGLRDEGGLSAGMLLAMLRAGEVPLFEAAFGMLAGLGPGILRRLLYEPGGEGLAILWRALSLPDAQFDEIHALTRHARGRPLADPATALQHLRAFRERMPSQSALAVLAFWRLSPDYRAARERVEARHRPPNAEGWR